MSLCHFLSLVSSAKAKNMPNIVFISFRNLIPLCVGTGLPKHTTPTPDLIRPETERSLLLILLFPYLPQRPALSPSCLWGELGDESAAPEVFTFSLSGGGDKSPLPLCVCKRVY